MEDELRKLGLRIRTRTVGRSSAGKPGQIEFDDRGNAVYQRKDDLTVEDSENGERARRRALAHPGLSLVEDEPAANAPIRHNAKGLRLGYNPYESGLLSRKDVKKKRDLRELSKGIEAKKKLDETQD